MPPAPSSARISYGPRRAPGARNMGAAPILVERSRCETPHRRLLYSRMVLCRSALVGPILVLLARSALSAQPAPPPPTFIARCATCHGNEARGTAQGPGLVMNSRVAVQSVEQLREYLQRGNPGAGMPAFADLPADDILALARYLRRINVETIIPPPADVPARHVRVGSAPTGGLAHLQRERFGQPVQPAEPDHPRQRRFSEGEMGVPDAAFRARSHPARSRRRGLRDGSEPGGGARRGDGTCVVDYSRPPTPGLVGDSQLGTNRGVALRGDTVYFVTDNAHLLALDRGTGGLRWDRPMAPDAPPSEPPHHYGGTIAPLVVRDMVVVGVSGADAGIRGFVAAFNAESGALVWRRWTVPRRGRTRHRDLAGAGADQRRWVNLADRLVRRILRYALLGYGQSVARRRRPRPSRRQPFYQLRPGAQRHDWRVEVALPVHAARRGGSRCHRAQRAGGSRLSRQTGKAAAPRRSQRLLLCARSNQRRGAAGQALSPAHRLGLGCRRRWTSGREGSAGVSGRRRQLVLHCVLTGNRLVLFPGAGRMRGQADWLPRSNRPAFPAGSQHRDRRHRVGSATAGAGAGQDVERRPRHGDAGCCSTASRTAASWPSINATAGRCGSFPPTCA